MTAENADPSFQRSATRAPVGRPVKLQFDDSLDLFEGTCQNISIGGMFILVEDVRQPGSLVRFELRVAERTAIRGLGEVVWSQSRAGTDRQPGIGVKFRFLEQRDRQMIFKLVSHYIKERLAKRHPSEAELGDGPAKGPAPSPPAAAPVTSFVDPAEALAADFDIGAERLGETGGWAVDSPPPGTAEPEPAVPEAVFDGFGAATGRAALGSEVDSGRRAAVSRERRQRAAFDPARSAARRRRARAGLALAMLSAVVIAVLVWRGVFSGDRETPGSGAGAGDAGGATTAAGPPVSVPESAPVAVQETSTAEPEAESRPSAVEPAPPPSVADPPPPSAEPRETPPPAPRSLFTRVVDISWQRVADGLEVVLETDGAIPDGRFRQFRLAGDSPREVIRLLGVRQRYDRSEIAGDGLLMRRIRTGYHRKQGGDELHVVLDLADPAARVRDLRVEGSRLTVFVERP